MRRRLITAATIACIATGIIGPAAASATEQNFFDKHIVLNSFAVSGTPRSTLFAGGGELKEDTGKWKFCAAYNPNGTSELDSFTCSNPSNGFVETFGTVAARAWIEVIHQSGSNAAHLIGEEYF